MSQRAPGYRFQYQVPPTSSASSNTTVVKPASRNRCRRYRPANPAPTTATSTCCVVLLLVDSEADAATIASGMPHLPCFYFAVGYSRALNLSSGQFQSSVAARAAATCSKNGQVRSGLTFLETAVTTWTRYRVRAPPEIVHHVPSSSSQPRQRLRHGPGFRHSLALQTSLSLGRSDAWCAVKFAQGRE